MRILSFTKNTEKYNNTIYSYIDIDNTISETAKYIDIYDINMTQEDKISLQATLEEVQNVIDVISREHPDALMIYNIINDN